ncbi:hypothetical protein IL306_009651, partial [Fusarium sp. DS 682]
IPRTMAPPKPFDLEGTWDTVDLDWDFMHVRTLFGSIQNWPDLYKKMIIKAPEAWVGLHGASRNRLDPTV